ncbi:hypothetical protein CPY51_22935 [Rhizobium tubonense]|uniref:HTH lysR-type domain-containing protein n=2 Tax=Rhizobium tubonense TaxID=484088 RepID=A0A2W4CJB5_9HYPH|nr:hypothetical protein CPY51_22935 [Rhizobium tubonense]
MVAKHIRTIEQRLGARLLHRTTRRHQLTEVGRLYYERSKHALAEVDAAEASASELQSSPRGRLRLVAPVSFGSESLVPALVQYLDQNLEVGIELILDNRAPDLISDGYELGIHIGEMNASDLVARPLKPHASPAGSAPMMIGSSIFMTFPCYLTAPSENRSRASTSIQSQLVHSNTDLSAILDFG